ncbi:cupin domain-containing protein [uncultured Psychroserpens sp.]|uniref:cupin domain-containing protein n=1 Tax=uncultured Psychroserpens sp. TaxID=255436 RepID=UPI00260EAC40|nr:cupin domain-containing protein [uncultured Psychroserpens sp.]
MSIITHIKKNNLFELVTFLLIILPIVSCKHQNTLPDPLEAGWNNKAVCEVLEDNDNIRVLKCSFPPGIGHEKHYHNPHFGYTLAGSTFKIKDTTGIREVHVPTDYSFSKDEISTHEVLNIGDSTAVFLIIEYK